MNLKNTEEFKTTLDEYRLMIERRKEKGEDYTVLQNNLKILENATEEELESIIEKNIGAFYHFSISKILYTSDKFKKIIIEDIRKTKIIPYDIVNKNGEEKFFKEHEYIDLILDIDANFLSEYMYKAPEDIIKRYIDKVNINEVKIYNFEKNLQECSDELRKYIINREDICRYLYLKSDYNYEEDFKLNDSEQRILWNNIKNEVLDIEINKQAELIEKFTNKDLRKEIFYELKLIEYIHMIYLNQEIIELLNTEDLYSLARTGDITLLKEILPFFSKEKQIEILNLRSDKIGDHWGYVLVNADPNVRLEFFYNYLHDFTFFRAFDLYKACKQEEILNTIVDALLSQDEIVNSYGIFTDNEFIDVLTEEQQNKLASKLKWPVSFKELSNEIIFNLKDSIITRKIISNILNIIDKPETFDIDSSDIQILTRYLSDEDVFKIIKKATKESLLKNALDETIYKYVMMLLKDNPNYFKNIYQAAYIKSYSINDNQVEEILKYLDEKQIIEFLSNACNSLSNKLVNSYKIMLMKDLTMIKTISQIYIFDDNEQDMLIKNLPLSSLNLIYYNDNLKKLFIEYRKEEFINSFIRIESKYDLSDYTFCINDLDISERIRVYNLIKPKLLIHFFNKASKISKQDEDYLINMISNNDLIEMSSIHKTDFLKLKPNTLDRLISSLKDYSIINFYCSTKISSLVSRIISILENDITILGHPKCNYNYDNFMLCLDIGTKNYIENQIDNMFNNLDIDETLKDMIRENSYKEKVSVIYSYNNHYLNNENMEQFKELLNQDKYLLYNLDFRLLSDDILSMGNHFVSKTSRYPEIVKELSWLFEFRPQKGLLCKKIVEELLDNDSKIIFDSKIDIILDYLCEYNDPKIGDIEIDNTDINCIIDYILERYELDNEILDNINCDIKDYYDIRINMCAIKIIESTNIEIIKNAFFTRYFWLSSKEIDNFLVSYAYGYDEVVRNYSNSTLPLEYIENINKIKNIDDIYTLKEIYNNGFIEYTKTDYINIISIMREAYNKSFEAESKNNQNNMVTNEAKININGTEVEVIELLDNFGLFVHSTDAYGNMNMINDNYYDSWNNNTNTANHGICSCYISNKSFGLPPIKDKGVLFGFTNINEESINLMAPYDLVTENDVYNIKSKRNPMYLRLNVTSDFTRHTHNEFSLERRNKDNKYPCTEPDCVVILSDMPDEIKENSLKAVKDFKERGIDLKVYYIDRVKLLNNEANKNNILINKYLESKDISILKDIINNYESLRCCTDFLDNIDIDTILNKQLIYDIIKSLVEELLKNNNLDKIKQFIDIIDNEKMKFTVIEECVGERAHTFDLLTPDIENNIELLRLKIRKGGLNNEFGRKINT